MKSFEYGDEKISNRELVVALPSIVLGVGILTLPKDMAAVTTAADGWVPILVGGIIAVVITWFLAKLAIGLPNQSLFTFTSSVLPKSVAIVISFFFAVIWVGVTAFEVREIANVSKQYLFDRTPVEVISLCFFLVVMYAVSGSRAGLFRLNMLFLPFVIIITIVVVVFNVGFFHSSHLLPLLETDLQGYVKGLHTSITSYVGFVIVLFYMGLVDHSEKTPKLAAVGMCIPIVVYLIIFIFCVGVFGHLVTANLLYPTVELAKAVEVPGGFVERFESIFFVIWIMAIFNTASMAFDIAVHSLNSIFKNTKKIKVILILAPIVYITSMFPQNKREIDLFGTVVFDAAFIYTLFIGLFLFIVVKVRRVRQIEK